MGYTTNRRAITRVKQHLDQMVAAENKIVWPANEPSKLAYQIREGITVSKDAAILEGKAVEPYHSYAKLKSKFIIRVESGTVVAEPRDGMPIEAVIAAVTIPYVTDEMEIVGAAIKHKAPELFFPNANLLKMDAETLYNWTERNGYYIVGGENGVTLIKDDPGIIAWRP